MLGARVTELYSLAEIRERHALRIAVVSLGERLNFGLTADPTLLPDVDQLADQIRGRRERARGSRAIRLTLSDATAASHAGPPRASRIT